MLTEDEAILLRCTEGSEACSWLVEEPEENQSIYAKFVNDKLTN